MSRNKKILIAAGGAVAAVLLALLVLPFLFVDRVEERVRAAIEQETRVRVAWDDVGLTFFRDFPHPTFSLSGLSVVGTGRFDGDTLATVESFGLALNGTSLFGAARGSRPLVVRSVSIEQPSLHLRVDEDGTASWDVLPDSEATDSDAGGRSLGVSLRSFELTNGSVVLDNAQSGLFVSLEGLTHSLRGDFSRDALVASTDTHADAVTVRFAGASYLGGVSLDFDADFDVDMTEQRARLIDNELRLNDLGIGLEGELAREGEDLAMDLRFGAPSTEFGQILSLVPVVYAQDFASLETSGTFTLGGSARGSYGRSAFPSFALDLQISDGSFRYPDLQLPARAIAADLSITNPGGDIDSTVVDLSRFHMEIDDQPLDASLTLRTPVSDPDVDVRLEGTLDLEDVARTVKLENADGLGGVLVADATMRARKSDVDSARYDRIDAQGTISARNVTLRQAALRQPVDIQEMTLELTPRTAELQAFDARLGSSDLQATGRLDNLLGFALGHEPLAGSGTFTSRRFVLDEWKSDNELEAISVPAMLDLTLDGTIGELAYSGLEMSNARGRAVVRDQRLTLEGFSLETLGGRIGMDGWYETLDPTQPTFAMDVVLDSLDVAGTADAFGTVRAFAPVARYARGTFSSELSLAGALGQDMSPVLDVLDGDGSLSTSQVAIEDFPLLTRLSEALQLQRLASPTVNAIRSTIHIQDGRLLVDQFPVTLAGLSMTVAGSNGIDQSIDYTLGMQVPRAGFADAVLSAADPVPVGVRVTGTVTQPSLGVSLSEAGGSVRDAATQAAGGAAGARIDEAQQRLDAEREAARERARARADSIVAEAERRAETIREDARRAADEIRAQGEQAAAEILARANNPVARAAAQPAAERVRQEAEQRATDLEREADERASTLVAEARARADDLLGAGN
ncbi:MAG: AsmA-like C-terminal region-containing protein [Gemmatimonadota bacterium]|jgi:hypothetical protein